MLARSTILNEAARSLVKFSHVKGKTIHEIVEIRKQAAACRRESGTLLRRARKLQEREI